VSSAQITLHPLSGRPGTPLAQALAVGDSYVYRGQAPLLGALPQFVSQVSGPSELLAEAAAGLPDGAARAEAVSARLRRRGFAVDWGEPEVVTDASELWRRCRAFGHSSIEVVRADWTLTSAMHLGTWFDAQASARLLRRLVLRGPVNSLLRDRVAPRKESSESLVSDVRRFRLFIDAAFWTGVRAAATESEWRRLTASAYVALLYHRIAGEDRPGEEKLDIAPARLASHLQLLRALRFTSLSADRQLGFHADPGLALPSRSVIVTIDDGLLDCAGPLARHRQHHPQLFVPTSEVGGRAHWLADQPLMDWDGLARLGRAGVAIGSHARRHRPLIELEGPALQAEIAGALSDLRERVPSAIAVLSYPNGGHNESVCAATESAGFSAAYTTEKGMNGAGTNPFCLKRVSVYAYDGRLALAWKALTGQAVPRAWERRRVARLGRGTARPPGTIRSTGFHANALVSLIMAAYGPQRDWLLRAVHSALGQRGCRVELIVVDDGSPEPVADLLASVDDPRLHVLRTSHGGPSAARNAGIRVARGEYLRFVDADDLLEPDGTAHLLGLMDGRDDLVTYAATMVCDESLRPLKPLVCRLDGSLATACLLDEVPVRVFSMLFPRSVVEAIGLWDENLPGCRDWDFSLRALEQAPARGDETIVTHYRRHSGGVTADSRACAEGERGVMERYFLRHPNHRGTSIERRCQARVLRTEAWANLEPDGDNRKRAMLRALALAPGDTMRELARTVESSARRAAGSLRERVRGPAPR
jgi:peptidoglycan/xylan/chitin deacetylase (PgdA/CDA1 family)